MSFALPHTLLVIEASTAAASVALVAGDRVVGDRDVTMGASRDDALLPAIASVLEAAGLNGAGVGAVWCGSGPGSFTGLRIAAALAKGLAVAWGAELHAVPSFLLAAAELTHTSGRYVLHGDALRGERYAGLFDVNDSGEAQVLGELARMPLAEVELLGRGVGVLTQLVAVGDKIVSAHDVRFALPRARNLVRLRHLLQTFAPVDIDSWEPAYGRLAEAQVKWELVHGRALPAG